MLGKMDPNSAAWTLFKSITTDLKFHPFTSLQKSPKELHFMLMNLPPVAPTGVQPFCYALGKPLYSWVNDMLSSGMEGLK